MNSIQSGERYESIDFLRGVAVLGILVMNIQSFSMPMAAYFNPTALGDRGPIDFAIWTASHLFFDQKFMTIFSLLFGAGIVVMTARAAERGARPAVLHYRRMFALLIFGLIHAYLIWDGDILVLYSVCGAIVYLFRRLSPVPLVAIALTSLIIGSGLLWYGGSQLPHAPAAARQEFIDFWAPPAQLLQRETAAFRGSWWQQMPVRVENSLEFHLSDIWLWGVWRTGAVMLIGMALFKWRVVTGERSSRFYAWMAVAGFLVGVPIIAFGVFTMNAHGWETFYSFFIGGLYNYWASLLVAGGWIGLLITIWRRAPRTLIAPFIAVGRTAFSCYILTSLICTTIFYGHGFGWFGYVSRPGQLAITLAVWIVLLSVAPLWLRHFRFGPLEWIWRTVTYWERPDGLFLRH